MVFWLLFSNESIQNILILSATVAPFASACIRPVVNRLNQDTMVYYGLVFCLFSWPNMVKWHNSGIIKPYNKHLIRLFFSVRTVNYGSSFFPSIYGPRASRLGHKWMEKSSVGNLQYGPKTRLIRGIYISVRLNIYMLFTGSEVRIRRNCARGLEYRPRP